MHPILELSKSQQLQAFEAALSTNAIHYVYQPKVRIDKTVYGVESLARWSDKKLGVIPPGIFIPLAEQLSIVNLLTLNAIDATIRQCAIWKANNVNINAAINVSAQDLHDPNIVVHMAQALERNNIAPSQITLELTETAIMHDRQKCAATIETLRTMGLGISVDDLEQATLLSFT